MRYMGLYEERRRKNTILVGVIIGIVIILLTIWIVSDTEKNDTVKINDKVESIGGTVISIDSVGIFESNPFILTKGEIAYKFTYKVNGETKTGWYKDGFEDKWVLDYQPDTE